MQLSTTALALCFATVWGGAMLLVGVLNLVRPPYGAEFLIVIGSVYPGIHGAGTLSEVLLGTVYGIIDGGIGGFLIAWLYNLFARRTGEGS